MKKGWETIVLKIVRLSNNDVIRTSISFDDYSESKDPYEGEIDWD